MLGRQIIALLDSTHGVVQLWVGKNSGDGDPGLACAHYASAIFDIIGRVKH